MSLRSSTRLPAAVVVALLAALLTTLLAVPATPAAAAPDLDDRRAQTEARREAVADARDRLEEALEDTDAQMAAAFLELQGIEAQIPVAQAQLAEAEAALARYQREAELVAQRLDAALAEEQAIADAIAVDEERADRTRAAIGQMARDAYKGTIQSSALSAVLDARSSEEFVEQSSLASAALDSQTRALGELEQLNGVNRNRQVRLSAVREEITVLKAEADAKVLAAEQARQAAADRTADLAALQAEAQAATAEIEARKEVQLAQQAELDAQDAALAADLRAIVAAQEEQRRREAEAAAAKGGGSGAQSGSTVDRPFINPSGISPMVVTSPYGMRLHPVLKYWRLHAGTDIRAYCGTPIYAAAAGTVQWAAPRPGFGNQVMLNHGYWKGSALMSSYNHLTRFAVGNGDRVAQGQLLGYSGNTGLSGACHLHFEAYVNGSTVDPRPMIDA